MKKINADVLACIKEYEQDNDKNFIKEFADSIVSREEWVEWIFNDPSLIPYASNIAKNCYDFEPFFHEDNLQILIDCIVRNDEKRKAALMQFVEKQNVLERNKSVQYFLNQMKR